MYSDEIVISADFTIDAPEADYTLTFDEDAPDADILLVLLTEEGDILETEAGEYLLKEG